MRIRYDPEVDALSIRLVEGPVQSQVIQLTDQVAVDIGADERIVALEILDASEVLPGFRDQGVSLENLSPCVRCQQIQKPELSAVTA
ncbi:MAG: hypothetical protein COZ06_22985 [Armatimonadetes bacterium CG_4_10_14_3_um_filter_66_18]|nr:DUF2283 domain-containing protein [Armatimonadota bacterium]OIP02242.1 MAG: hypothetical protein AUJ96_16515 [Armatimonadetes bacterium CG2_30_66_41]PIU94111.1 MAG: hypothetical protein COS65_09350 [Armatimonadetes bacterium CG06_land_8_20_14_3_00_66_21]PIX47244.1 MAG: hypothetical protein COZ57_09095 [Armatimonadetes bacterium CG_4_8_14_3_um_filter_66_20]PIY43402.1 MAG: hypothetical protein COZ06_22985 [Armatimonadetes bacterium CG_4_10_14_3_um_filter_66_18]PIZ46279.1 MAG: hypothetical pro